MPGNQKQTQQKSAMITKNGLLRPNRNSSLITSSKPKSKPTKIESIEPDIDFTNIPTIQGTYKAEKVNVTNKTNSTQETAKAQSDTKNNTKVSLLPTQEQSTNKSIIMKNSTETSQTVTQTVTNKMNEKLNYTVHDESFSNVHSQSSKKITTSTTASTIKTEDQDVFKDFRNPDFETSPWKPIIPGYINTELKLLPDNVEKTNYKTETNYKVNYTNANVGDVVSDTSMKMTPQYSVQGEIPEIPTKPSEPLGMLNSYADVPGMSTFDIRDTDFPRDRIVPQEMVNFRVNGKFKNKIPGLLEDGQMFTESSPIELDDKRPDIEVSGQLPSETYDVKLRTSSKPFGFSSSQPLEFSSTKPHPSTNENETGWRVAGSLIADTRYEESIKQDDGVKEPDDSIKTNKKKMDQSTAKDKESSDNLLLSVISSTQKWPAQFDYEESTTKVSGVGVAEPVPDVDVELEPRNRYTEVQAMDKQQNNALKDRKVDKNGQEPIYTSYKTPDLNGGGMRPSLIESSGTLKPFRHTIPVDKITSVVDYSKRDEEGSLKQEINTVTDSIINQERFTEASQLSVNSSKGNNKEAIKILPENLKEIIELETFKKTSNDSETVSTKNSRIEEHRGTRPIELNTESIIDDEKFLKLSTTEVYSEMIHPLYNNVDKLVVRNEGNKERLTSNISRNSTFIEIDTLKHTPGEDEEDDSSKDKSSTKKEGFFNGTVNRPYNSLETRKKIYNDTLKAYVVENLVTLAPAKSNTGIGRPVRPRPKIDYTISDDSELLDRLFRAPSRDRNTTKRNSSNGRDTIAFQSTTNNEGKDSNKEHPKIEQIVEVVTSISTKVSSNFKGNPIVLKFVVTNSTSLPVIHSESHGEQVSSSQISVPEQFSVLEKNSKEENRSFGDKVSNKTPSLTSDRKISTIEENRSLLERLKQFAEIGAENEPVKGKDNSKSHGNVSNIEQEDHRPLPDFEKLKQIADIATGNETLMNSSAGFTMTRDGVEILTKILNKMEDRTDKMISSTEENLEAGNFIF